MAHILHRNKLARPIPPAGRREVAGTRREVLWWGFLLFMCTAPFPFMFQHVDPNNPFSLLQEKSLYIYFKIVTMIPFFRRAWTYRDRLIGFVVPNVFLMLFVILAWLSTIWSLSAYLAGRTAFDMTLTLIACATVASTFDPKFVVAVLRCVFQIIIVLSLVWIVAVPSQAIHNAADVFGEGLSGDFRGIYIHKNVFGQAMALSLIFFWLRMERLGTAFTVTSDHVFFVLSVVLLALSRCQSGVVIVLFSILFIAWLKAADTPRLILAAAVMSMIGLYIAFAQEFNALAFSLLHRDATFTGRTQGWAYVVQLIRQRLLTGYGYGATGYLEFRMMMTVSVFASFVDPHNGYLDILVELGVPGLICFIAWAIPVLVRAVIVAGRASRSDPRSLLCVIVGAWLMAAMVEVSPFQSSTPTSVAGFLATCVLSLAVGHAKRRRRPAPARGFPTRLPV